MKAKKLSPGLVLYELRNLGGEWYVYFFGIVLPVFLCAVIPRAFASQVPKEAVTELNTSVMLTMTLVIPMSIMFLGYGALYAQEVEKGIPLRMRLFGFGEKTMMAAKIIANLIFMSIAMVIFGIAVPLIMQIEKPAASSLVCLIVCLYALGIIFLVMAHAIAGLLGRFGPAYAVMMIIYFFFMVISGMMGARINQLPRALQAVAKTFPMFYISNDFIDFWQGEAYHFMPLLQSVLFFGAVAGILMFLFIEKNKRAVH